MNIRAGLTALGVSMATLGPISFAPIAQANSGLFGTQDLTPGDVVAIAVPLAGGEAYNLVILEQLDQNRACWREQGGSPTVIDPLLLQFDFTGICGRSTDSNGYSLRLGEQDMAWRYRLQLVQERGAVVLKAFDVENPGRSPIEVGDTGGLAQGMLKINLNPGWRMAKRTYEGKTLGHIYLANERPRDQLVAAAPRQEWVATAPTTYTSSKITEKSVSGSETIQIFVPPYQETTSRPNETLVAAITVPAAPEPIVSLPSNPSNPNVLPVPQRSIPTYSSSNTGVIRLEEPGQQPPPPPNSVSLAQSLGLRYRVVVDAQTPEQKERLKAVIPDAFHTWVGDRRMMQAGAFAAEFEAQDLQMRLRETGLAVQIVPVQ
ncbi:DUF3747 domain-containing protein [Picosynechococcus sp. PCC 7117]|uniref:DUF3747 domain-containing protein n=1 Tax=Picosynechococcus sp. PCC 7117 TaxID=195498 RepID=UPI00081074C4|nr:DUF3747 domain-containing protein [Picosynechococcus sp. PCC 7117]ANV86694.1 hypothetical protein AWQ22_03975 [Picosynechococcus sp. PCC 7117]